MNSPPGLVEAVNRIRWFHRIDLGHGLVTPGLDNTPAKLARIQLPMTLAGKSVLDVGAWDGFFSFEAERRGADRVVAVDSYCWSGAGWADKAGFDLAHAHLGSRVESIHAEVLDIDPGLVGHHDLVFFLGVLYHLRHPLLALEKIAAVTRECLILETKVDLLHVGPPALAYFHGTELNRDPTNWWAPNLPGLLAMLRTVGFVRCEVVSPPKSLCQRVFRKPTQPGLWWRELQQGRVTVHAFKS